MGKEDPTPEEIFSQAFADTQRLSDDPRGHAPSVRPPKAPQRSTDDGGEAKDKRESLVAKEINFDPTGNDAPIEGVSQGVDHQILERLKRGAYPIDDRLDLHRMTQDPAKKAVEAFIDRAKRDGLETLLIIHGRGLHSQGKVPVLKQSLKHWLARGQIAQHVLAFSAARPQDGGAGAIYIRLRR